MLALLGDDFSSFLMSTECEKDALKKPIFREDESKTNRWTNARIPVEKKIVVCFTVDSYSSEHVIFQDMAIIVLAGASILQLTELYGTTVVSGCRHSLLVWLLCLWLEITYICLYWLYIVESQFLQLQNVAVVTHPCDFLSDRDWAVLVLFWRKLQYCNTSWMMKCSKPWLIFIYSATHRLLPDCFPASFVPHQC